MADTTYYYGYRTVDPITNAEPFKACIYKGVVYHWNTTGTHQIEVYRSWRTFSSPVDATNDAQDWIAEAPGFIRPLPHTSTCPLGGDHSG